LLTIFYLYKVLCSCATCATYDKQVVNCLQFFIFTRFFAVSECNFVTVFLLWIAYNFLSLQGSLQSMWIVCLMWACCELLTIFYLYKVLCSLFHDGILALAVVNCLQFFIFTRFFAVPQKAKTKQRLLWIAYNFLSLQGSLQFSFYCVSSSFGCELLTIFYLYKVLCSAMAGALRCPFVVNCLQFFIFTRFFAVKCIWTTTQFPLWIAYNFLSLQGSLQSSVCGCQREYVVNCLQFFIFTRFFAVLCFFSIHINLVVNCLQFFIFTRFFAVWILWMSKMLLLWIAYNFLSLQGSLQFTFFIIIIGAVVNCLQFFIFTRFFAVERILFSKEVELWIAYNFLSLQGSLQ